MKKNQGFTLIELVVVILILGILAAVALPRFINVSQDAHRVEVKGTGGALASAILLVRAQYEVNRHGSSGSCGTPLNCQIDVQGFGNNNVDVNANGWPVATGATGTPAATTAMGASTCNEVFRSVLQASAPTVGTSEGTDYLTTASGTVCTFTYQPDNQNSAITYDASNGDVSNTIN
ncbi:type II secretion system protein [Pseudomonas fluorescens]|uniref:Pilin n=1 Tax=Pseudomonas fluorescens TaxID=294 RepID=A0A5E7FB59_PSEFL|nr:type II secretion system protein [Pseudomonas fluorescens]VVO34763.1 hypothetical protein PS723_05285 [Pseudomonas fluorescens]